MKAGMRHGANAKVFAVALCAMLFALGSAVEAQQLRAMPLIGYLDYGAAIDKDEAFFQALRDLGWIEGQNIAIEYRWAEGRLDGLPALAKELVALKVDLIVTRAAIAIQAAKSATTTIPIVMVRGADAVENKLIVSLARPGGNVTGMSEDQAELHTKVLELLHETLPRAKRVAVLWNPASAPYTRTFRAVQAVAPTLRLTIQSLEFNHYLGAELRHGKLEGLLEGAAKEPAGALMVMPAMYTILGRRIAAFAIKNRMPVVFRFKRAGEAFRPARVYVQHGGHVPPRCDVRG